MLKRTLCIIIFALTALSLCACGKTGGEPAASPGPEAAATAETTVEVTRAPISVPTACPIGSDSVCRLLLCITSPTGCSRSHTI